MRKKARAGLKEAWRNITVAKVEADALNRFQAALSAHLGFRVTLTQSMSWLVANGERLLQRSKERDDAHTDKGSPP